MHPAVFPTKCMQGGHGDLPHSQSALVLLSDQFALQCFTSKFYHPALPTLVGSQNQVSTVLGKYFHWSSFSVTVPLGGHWQGWFPLTWSSWKPPSVPHTCAGPPPTFLGTSSLAHLLVMSLNATIPSNVSIHKYMLWGHKVLNRCYYRDCRQSFFCLWLKAERATWWVNTKENDQ